MREKKRQSPALASDGHVGRLWDGIYFCSKEPEALDVRRCLTNRPQDMSRVPRRESLDGNIACQMEMVLHLYCSAHGHRSTALLASSLTTIIPCTPERYISCAEPERILLSIPYLYYAVRARVWSGTYDSKAAHRSLLLFRVI